MGDWARGFVTEVVDLAGPQSGSRDIGRADSLSFRCLMHVYQL